MVKFGGKIGTLYQMLKNAFKKHPLQNRTNVQIKGGGGQRPFEQCSKKRPFYVPSLFLHHLVLHPYVKMIQEEECSHHIMKIVLFRVQYYIVVFSRCCSTYNYSP